MAWARVPKTKHMTLSRLLLAAGTLLVALPPAAVAQTPDANDLVWQKSISNYDRQRASLLQQVDREAKQGRFQPTWDSLSHYEIPTWYQDAKFGIFIHWGVYSVPAFDSEWYPRKMYLKNSKDFLHHRETYGPQSTFGYKNFIPQFTAARFDPNGWADLFRKAGAKYVVPVAEHHDGFPMYHSELTDWSAFKMGPKRDIVGELATAVRKAGMHFGASSHRAEHYFFMNGGRDFDSDVNDPKYASFYGPAHVGVTDANHQQWAGHPDPAYLDDWLARTAEIVTRYHPEIVWFDWWINTKEFQPYLQRFAAFYYNEAAKNNYPAAINYKFTAFPESAAVLDIERGQLESARNLFWQTDTSVSIKAWGYIEGDTFRSPESLILQLVDIVSKNGSLLLNVGPKPDGTIPDEVQQILLSMGHWLSVNGEAIYGTRPWKIQSEGPTKVKGGSFHDTATQGYSSQDIRFTTRGDTLYAIAMGWPKTGSLVIKSLAKGSPRADIDVKSVELIGSGSPVKWTRDEGGLHLDLPAQPVGEYAYVFKISR